MKYHNYVAVIGCMYGDCSDSCFVYEHITVEDAIAEFTDEQRTIHRMSGEYFEHAKANGEGVLISHVLVSDSPIEHVS